jgi:hypothetical protein
MLRLKSIALFTAILITTPQFAQQYQESNTQNGSNVSRDLQNFTTRANQYNSQNTTGTPYLNEEFETGSLINENVVVASNVLLRYNAVHDEFQIKQSPNERDDRVQAVRKAPEVYVKIGDNIFTYVIPGNGVGGYYNVLFEGKKLNLYKKYSKKFIEGQKSVNMMTGDVPNRLVNESSYFIVNSKGEFTELPNSRNRKFQAIAGDNRNELRKYAGTNNLNINREEDLIQLVEYYDSKF